MEKLLIFKPDNIGDVVLLSGTLRYFRRLFPRAEISLAVQQHIINLVELCPYVDRVVAVESLVPPAVDHDLPPGLSALHRGFWSIRRSFACRYDTVVFPVRAPQPQHLEILKGLSSDRVFGIVGCHVNAVDGYRPGFAPADIFTEALDVSRRNSREHEFGVLHALLNHLGAGLPDHCQLTPEFWFSPHDTSLLPRKVAGSGPVIGISPFPSGAERSWPLDRYLPVLQAVSGLRRVVIFGGSDQQSVASSLHSNLLSALDAEVLNFAGQTTLRQLALTISDCSALISVDTSGLHIGLARGTPTVGIVGGGHYGMFVPWEKTEKGIFLTNRLDCFNCNWRCTRETNECIQGVSPEVVARAVIALLQ